MTELKFGIKTLTDKIGKINRNDEEQDKKREDHEIRIVKLEDKI